MTKLTRVLASVFAFILLVSGMLVPGVSMAQDLRVSAAEPRYAAIVVEASTGEVLYSRRADSPRYPASISKVMTLYIAFEEMAAGRLRPDDLITVSPRAASMPPTKLGLRPGDTITVDDAIRAIALRSANDMAVALAERIGGSESRFAALMTLRAQELGMQNSRFVNASGLPDSRQISSARDIAILARAVMRDYPQYYSYFSQRSFEFRGQTITNHNGLLRRMPEVDGLKTGYIRDSGYNLAASGVRNGHRIIAVVLGGNSTRTRDDNVEQLLLTGFDIMRRRDLGETIVATQTMFEPTAPPPTQYARLTPSPGQGDVQTTSDVMFTGTARTPTITLVNPRDTALRPTTPTNPRSRGLSEAPAQREDRASSRSERGRWSIQVGAFRQRSDAREQLELVSDRFARQVRGARATVGDRTGGMYRSTFTGMTEDNARAACAALRARRQPCMVIAP